MSLFKPGRSVALPLSRSNAESPKMKIGFPQCVLLFMMAAMSAACGTQGSVPQPETPPSALEISITPRLPAGDVVESIDIDLQIPAPDAQAGDVLLTMAIVRVMMPSAIEDPDELSATDAMGGIPLTIEEDPVDPSAFRQDRRWIAGRTTSGDVSVHYTLVPREITPATLPGPLVDTRTEGSGFYGSGNTMLALPPEGWPRRVRLKWDLSELPAGARGASSFGEGLAEKDVSLENISNTFFMAGPLNSQPADGSGEFVVYWITPPAFDLADAASVTEMAYAYFTEVFGPQDDAFRVFMRTTERFQGGGGGGFNSFIFGTVAGQDRMSEEVRGLLAHETLHHFVGGYGEGGGAGGQQWYSEGATSYYTIVLPYRAGLTSLEQYIKDFNALALNYYTNPRSNLSNEEITARFFSDRNAQLVPYNRGPLYFASLDHKIRAKSGGTRTVDDVVRTFIAHRDTKPDAVAYWRELMVDTLGPEGGDDFDAMMAGGPLDLPPDLFGPCFIGKDSELRDFSQGFRTFEKDGVLTLGQVVPGSSAELAGIQRDDALLNPEALTDLDRTPAGSTVTLQLSRNGDPFEITYAPWTPAVMGRQWARTEVPESDCF